MKLSALPTVTYVVSSEVRHGMGWSVFLLVKLGLVTWLALASGKLE